MITKEQLIEAMNLSGNNNDDTAKILSTSVRSIERYKAKYGLTNNQYETKIDKTQVKAIKNKHESIVKENKDLKKLLEAVKVLDDINTHKIKAKKLDPANLTAVVLASDWHAEETVESESVNEMNEYNLNIFNQRSEQFFVSVVRLLKVFGKDTKIDNLILALLGDFINGQLREEAMENNSLRPTEALILVGNVIASGIQYILDNSIVNLIIPCHSGNHSRITKKVHISTESGNSLEYVLYHRLAAEFKNSDRVKFIIPKSYHSYVDIEGFIIRFHHGHSIRYNGGVGGIYIGVNKAIAQWNKVKRADLDAFAHFHQLRDGGNFICNGSVIGWNQFANFIKADFEKPKQAFFLVDHKRKEKTLTAQVFLE